MKLNIWKYLLVCCFRKKNNNILHKNMSSDLVNLLENVEYRDTIPFVPPIQYGKVIKVYDGDTITIASVLPNTTEPIYRFSIRLNGIDTPEIRGKTQEEKELAIQVRDALADKIYGKMVELRNVGNEKYGRVLADIYLDGENINQWLVDENFAVAYDGGKKHRPASWG
jgi:endonuclease YncB( thermonuclease family)